MDNDKGLNRLIPTLILTLIIITIGIIPLKVIGYGFLPVDDALRHAAKAISGKDWSGILVLRSGVAADNHPGWHAILGFLHKAAGLDADGLVVFSVVALFAVVAFGAVFLLYRPEAWAASLLIFAVTDAVLINRLFFGRPYIATMGMMVILCLIWQDLRSKKVPYRTIVFIALMTAVVIWIHGGSYLFALPVLAFLLAREWRAAFFLTVSILCGVIAGASFTGHPFMFLRQDVTHMLLAFSGRPLQRMLVGEFQSFTGDAATVMIVLFILIWRGMRGSWDKKLIDNPVFILAALGWALGFAVKRFWLDWGFPALSVWLAIELQETFDRWVGYFSLRRLFLTAAITVTLYLAVTADVNSRWTYNLTKAYLRAENPKHAAWLPEPDGVVYSDDMTVFYDMFFANPKAPWRYMLGFEPALMPPEDLAVYRQIQWNFGAYEEFEPWVKKMRQADRLILRRPGSEKPDINDLEWHYAATGIWVGRPPKRGTVR